MKRVPSVYTLLMNTTFPEYVPFSKYFLLLIWIISPLLWKKNILVSLEMCLLLSKVSHSRLKASRSRSETDVTLLCNAYTQKKIFSRINLFCLSYRLVIRNTTKCKRRYIFISIYRPFQYSLLYCSICVKTTWMACYNNNINNIITKQKINFQTVFINKWEMSIYGPLHLFLNVALKISLLIFVIQSVS